MPSNRFKKNPTPIHKVGFLFSAFVLAFSFNLCLMSTSVASNTISGTVNENGWLELVPPNGYRISGVQFASYGTPVNYQVSRCHASSSVAKVQEAINNNSLTIRAINSIFGDPCSGVGKRLSVVLVIEAEVVQRSLAAPSNLQGQINSSTVTVSWSAPIEGNTTVERYAIFWSYDNWSSGWAISSTTLSASIPNIPAGQQVQIKVRADNDSLAVYSGWSNEINLQAVSTPEPSTSPSPEPVPSPSVTPAPVENPEPTSTPTPVVEPSPTPTPEPSPEQSTIPTQSPSSTPSPSTSNEPSPEPSPSQLPEVLPSPIPTPTPEPAPDNNSQLPPSPTPSVEPTPLPAIEPSPVLTPTPIPEPVVEPLPIPAVPPIVEPAPTIPEPRPIEEPAPSQEEVQPRAVEPIEPAPVPPIEESLPEPTPAEPPVVEEAPTPVELPPAEVLNDALDDGKITSADIEAVVDSLMADGKVTNAEATKLIETLSDGGALSKQEEKLIIAALFADGKVTESEVNNLSESLAADGKFTNAEKELVAEALIVSAAGEAVSAEAIKEAGIDYADLPDATPVDVRTDENGNEVIITAVVADALELLASPAEMLSAIFKSPAQLIFALGNLGADMSPAEREEATKTVVAATLVGNIAAASAVGAVGYRRVV